MIQNFYNFLLKIPDYLFPFSALVDGKRVRGIVSYNYVKAICEALYGNAYQCVNLLVYREIFHVLGSVFALLLALGIGKILSNKAITVNLLILLIIFITFQEFYLHPYFYGQVWRKGVFDWLAWVLPVVVWFLIVLGKKG